MSLRTRVLVGVAAVGLVLLLAAVAVTRSTRDHLLGQVDAQLHAVAPRVPGAVGEGSGPGETGAPRLSELYVGRLGAEGGLVTVLRPDLRGDTAATPTPSAGQLAALRSGETVTVGSDGDSRYRLAARPVRRGGLVVIGLSLDDVDDAVRRLVALQAIALAGAGVVLALVAWWVVRLGVRPVREMAAAAGAIGAGDLSRRVPGARAGTEAAALSSALNGMLTQIEAAFEERTQAEARLRRFVADASHELRTPVTTIRGYAEMHRRGALSDPAARDEAMRRTEEEAIRMGGLVDDLLLLARLDQGRPLDQIAVDVATLAADAVADARAVAPDRALTLEGSGPAAVVGDEGRLRQVVANLLTNALVHAPGAPITVRVATSGDEVVLEVHDDGPGMPPEAAERAFERFYRADASRSRHQGGAGLGLSMVEAIVGAHGGAVSLRSSPAEGTTVTVSLPAGR